MSREARCIREHARALLIGGVVLLGAIGAGCGGGGQPKEALRTPPDVGAANRGKIVFQSDRKTYSTTGYFDLFVMNADGTGVKRLTGNKLNCWHPRWSPDGRRIAFDGVSFQTEGNQIFVMNANGTGLRQLTHSPHRGWCPAWSPDGRRIVFSGNRLYHIDLWVMSADGSEPQLLTPQGGEDGDNAAPSWSPDGRKIAFASNRDLDWEIFVMDANGSGVKQLTRNTAWDDHPVWSPDGRKIAFQSHRTGDFEIFVMNANGTGQKKLSKNAWSDQNPCWSADGRKIVFDSQHGGARGDPEGDREVFVMNADGTGVKQQLTRNSPADDRCPSWCPVR